MFWWCIARNHRVHERSISSEGGLNCLANRCFRDVADHELDNGSRGQVHTHRWLQISQVKTGVNRPYSACQLARKLATVVAERLGVHVALNAAGERGTPCATPCDRVKTLRHKTLRRNRSRRGERAHRALHTLYLRRHPGEQRSDAEARACH